MNESSSNQPPIKELATDGDPEELQQVQTLHRLREVVECCKRCPLAQKRQNGVFGEGDPDARLVCVGEAPGRMEDETGRPFVGPAGKLLDRLLMSVGFLRREVYICNVLKSRPPNNRDPQPQEVQACWGYLVRQIELIKPEVIVTFGRSATQTLLDRNSSLGQMRGSVHRFRDVPLVATYHPAALLRNPKWTQSSWEDLQLARDVLAAGQTETQQSAPQTPSATEDRMPTQQKLDL